MTQLSQKKQLQLSQQKPNQLNLLLYLLVLDSSSTTTPFFFYLSIPKNGEHHQHQQQWWWKQNYGVWLWCGKDICVVGHRKLQGSKRRVQPKCHSSEHKLCVDEDGLLWTHLYFSLWWHQCYPWSCPACSFQHWHLALPYPRWYKIANPFYFISLFIFFYILYHVLWWIFFF